jgi:hypothetical protein
VGRRHHRQCRHPRRLKSHDAADSHVSFLANLCCPFIHFFASVETKHEPWIQRRQPLGELQSACGHLYWWPIDLGAVTKSMTDWAAVIGGV